MELKVWVEGIQRVVCGVTEKTTCQDVVYALAHATGRTGRFTLIERWRNNERLLAPLDHPLRVLTKWGEHSNDVHFILQRTPLEGLNLAQQPGNQAQSAIIHPTVRQTPNVAHSPNSAGNKMLPNSHTFPPPLYRDPPRMPPPYRDPPPVDPEVHSFSSNDQDPNLRNQFHGVKSPTPTHRLNMIKKYKSQQQSNSPSSAASGAHHSPRSYCPPPDVVSHGPPPAPHQLALRNLQELVDNQRARILAQHAELAKLDSEAKEAEEVIQEVNRLENILDACQNEVQELRVVEDDAQQMQRQEKDLEHRLSQLRSQLMTCEKELTSGRGKIQSLSEVLAVERRQVDIEEQSSDEDRRIRRTGKKKTGEAGAEIEGMLQEIDRQKAASEELRQTADRLEEKIQEIEKALSEKRKIASDLAQEMRELNLESLMVMPIPVVSPDAARSSNEGLSSKRKIVGSPRQLETAAPTPKNPQGVWV
ncbi:unnamed protein product [Notodromas monacha]|uniref:Ras-associating domain-containing protein n=1 Tax=Notodromas monacha TaxID=399045 RepID=A0A7R9GGH5_9CRUS|nr:unnamed protein product [Notodromas monacha]CAG0919946.1 unnamed protein product [Notodromas monacha]